ncbi:MAG: Holliday junction resolvase RecU [Eubacterium sp.]|nr:Holliday junction resolvase RecU [Eubacterium sp.]
MKRKSRGLRGSLLEAIINESNNEYRENSLALIQKVPTPITPIEIDESTRHITLAYFDSKSTVDYIGVVQGIPVAFDAKECKSDTFPLQNIHEHQMKFMGDFENQDGIAFFIIYFTHKDIYYYLKYDKALYFWNRMLEGGRKSFKTEELDEEFFFRAENGYFLPYLNMIQKDLEQRKGT